MKGPPPATEPARGDSVDTEDDPAFRATVLAGEATSSARRALPPALADRYEDIELLGEGGMGVVYRAHDPRLGRAVALKLIKGDDPGLIRRFIQEARAQARVQHEHVCRVYEAGLADGEPYIVMQLVRGEPLSRLGAELSLEEGVKLMREVSLAVHEAHRLGLIHRDLKPQNILVERAEDGSNKPYVVDFGLAREVEERGQTVTGAVVGTPAYMPPEQALGEVRALDRRSDVYSLGATLFDLVAGQPPFTSEHPWQLLMKVAYEDAPSIGRIKKGIPADLETIVMKCLERDPARRYDSARALAEDLGRFLDGDPIQGRRASFGYVAWKRIKKHKLLAALGVTALAAAISLGGVWFQGRRDAREQAVLAQALGEDVKGMELFLRTAYGMPLHDVERERDIVRARLSRIESTMKKAGRAGHGPGHYAMGRGLLALGDPAGARAHLTQARAAGYASGALELALGQALGELYRRAVEEARRVTNQDERKRKEAAIAAELRDPALAHLRAAVGAEVESPAHVEGLIALYQGRNEEALQKARLAFAEQPWLYEAKKLEGDAHYALGSPFRHDAAFDWDKMMAHFQPAAEAYRAAAEIARSDPGVHRAECELWEKIGLAEGGRNGDTTSAFEQAGRACGRAVAASSGDAQAKVQQALTLSAQVSALASRPREDAIPLADEAVRSADEAVRARPEEVMAHYARARALYYRAVLLDELGRDVSGDPARVAYEKALELDPQFVWAICELGDVLLFVADIDRRHGRDPRPALQSAGRQFDRASLLDPAFSMPAQRRVRARINLLEDEIERGQSSEESVKAALEAVSSLERWLAPGSFLVVYWKARVNHLRAQHELALGRDPSPFTRAALDAIGAHEGGARGNGWLLLMVGECKLVLATFARASGDTLVEEARKAVVEGTLTGTPDSDVWRLLAARVELLAMRHAMSRGDAGPERFEVATAHLRPMLAKGAVDAHPHQLMAEIHARRASWLARRRRDPREAIDAGNAHVREALARNPHHARALATQGSLALVEARAARDDVRRASAARRARESFDAALRENPRLARDHEDELTELAVRSR